MKTNEYVRERIFWDQEIKYTDWSDSELVQGILNDADIMKSCSIEFLATAETYAKEHKLPGYADRPDNRFKVGVLNSHPVDLVIGGAPLMIELPEVTVKADDKPYVTYLENVDKRDLFKAFSRALAYCYRLGISTGRIVTIAMKRGKYKWSTVQRFQAWAKRVAGNLKTVDYWLADWFMRAVEYCNTIDQMLVLKQVYIQAATYNTKQPRICKKTLSALTGVHRQVIRRLFDRLIKAGLMTEQPEGYRYVAGLGPKSEARIINLDPTDLDRWSTYEVLPSIDRTKKDIDMEDLAPVTHLENDEKGTTSNDDELPNTDAVLVWARRTRHRSRRSATVPRMPSSHDRRRHHDDTRSPERPTERRTDARGAHGHPRAAISPQDRTAGGRGKG